MSVSANNSQAGKPALFFVLAVVLLSVGLSSWAAAQANAPIKIGILLPKSGTYTVQGENGHNGDMLAVEDFGGKVLGRPIQLIWEDESTPQATVQSLRKMIEVDKVIAVDGFISSGNTLAAMPVAEQNKILLMASGTQRYGNHRGQVQPVHVPGRFAQPGDHQNYLSIPVG